jgi:hypothetical protein
VTPVSTPLGSSMRAPNRGGSKFVASFAGEGHLWSRVAHLLADLNLNHGNVAMELKA